MSCDRLCCEGHFTMSIVRNIYRDFLSNKFNSTLFFSWWILYFIGEILPHSRSHHKWILRATKYYRKWVESFLVWNRKDTVLIEFLEDNILTRFGFPQRIITNNTQALSSMALVDFYQNYNIILGHSMTYYPKVNGFAEALNKNLMTIIKWVLEENKIPRILSLSTHIV